MLNIAIAGLGTVGTGVLRVLRRNAEIITARAGQPITVKAVSARDKYKKRDCHIDGITWVDDPRKLAQMPDVHAVVELIGGANGIALAVADAAIKNRKHLITANKALLATHGVGLANAAHENKVQLLFEASVCGGVPVIKMLREGLAGNRLSSMRGILNGTCNYILTRMGEAQSSFVDALRGAQDRGFAEADPAADVDGHDTANKLAILSALAFGIEPDLASISVQGIRHITLQDLQFAGELDCKVKLLGVARLNEAGLEQRVGPVLVPKTSPFAAVDGALNAVQMHGDFAGDILMHGLGAGAEPTASAVVADIIDLAHGACFKTPVFGQMRSDWKSNKGALSSPSRYYMRLQLMDKPGVVADISAILRDEGVSFETLLQRGKSATQSVPVVLTTHEADADAMHRATVKIAGLLSVAEPPCLMRIED